MTRRARDRSRSPRRGRYRNNRPQVEQTQRQREQRQSDIRYGKETRHRRQDPNQDDDLANEQRFHLKQAIERSRIRLKGGRARPIDLLLQYVDCMDNPSIGGFHGSVPHDIFKTLDLPALEDLASDVKVMQDVDSEIRQGKHRNYWKSLAAISAFLLSRADALAQQKDVSEDKFDENEEMTTLVDDDLLESWQEMVEGKSSRELNKLLGDAVLEIKKGDQPGYWGVFYKFLKCEQAKFHLVSWYESYMEAYREKCFGRTAPGSSESESNDFPFAEAEDDATAVPASVDAATLSHQQQAVASAATDRRSDRTRSAITLTPGTDYDIRDQSLVTIASKDMTNDDSSFGGEVALNDSVRTLKKPRYFNRVITGYTWNSYNKKHYDRDNPPPKVIQGYKFNIFYPLLKGSTQTPSFTITPDPEDADWATIRFSIGDPYQDIGFRVRNAIWLKSKRHGFRSQFDRGVFQLWFRFKRLRYRR
eukprot:Clim_evm111s157 gene=Clim_evmTU111s157